MANEIATCKQCRHKTPDHYCTHPQTQDKEGKPCLARHVWYVSYNDRGDYCAGKFFEPAIATPNAIGQRRAACGASAAPTGCASNGSEKEE